MGRTPYAEKCIFIITRGVNMGKPCGCGSIGPLCKKHLDAKIDGNSYRQCTGYCPEKNRARCENLTYGLTGKCQKHTYQDKLGMKEYKKLMSQGLPDGVVVGLKVAYVPVAARDEEESLIHYGKSRDGRSLPKFSADLRALPQLTGSGTSSPVTAELSLEEPRAESEVDNVAHQLSEVDLGTLNCSTESDTS